MNPYIKFSERVKKLKTELIDFVSKVKSDNKTICVLGASTKGNVLLQYCEFTEKDIPYVGEVNPEKYGHYTPGTKIPIISEDELMEKEPDFLLVLPWHFKEFFLASGKFGKSKLVFPLPELSVDECNTIC